MFKRINPGSAIYLAICLLLASCNQPMRSSIPDEMPNPAASFCEDQGYRYQIQIAADGERSGLCIFGPADSCDGQAYFQGECSPGQKSVETHSASTEEETPNLVEFTDPNYQLSLSYPADWVLASTPLGEHTPPANLLQFRKNGWIISLLYKHAADITVIGGGLGPGEIQESDPVARSGQVYHLSSLVHEGKTKLIWCGFSLDDLEIYARVEASEGSDFSQVDIPPSITEEIVRILESISRKADLSLENREEVDGWVGTLVSARDMPQVDDYFQMLDQNGSRYGIHALDPVLLEGLISYRDTGALIMVWGTLYRGRMDAYNTQIEIDHFEEFKE